MARYPRDKDFQVIRKMSGKSYYRFKVEGLDDLVKDLGRMAGELAGPEGVSVVNSAAAPVAARMRANVPVDHGLLKQSIRQTKGKRDRRGAVASVLAGYPYRRTGKGKPRAGYALQVEYGTENTPEQPFIRPAFDGHEVSIAEDIKRHLRLRVIKWRFNKSVGRS